MLFLPPKIVVTLLFCRQPKAHINTNNPTNTGEAIRSLNELKNHLIPSEESNERTPSTRMADSSHERITSNVSAITVTRQSQPSRWWYLLVIRFEVVNIQYTQLQGSYNQSRGIHTCGSFWEEFLDEFVLTFLQTFHTEGHASQIGDLFFGIA